MILNRFIAIINLFAIHIKIQHYCEIKLNGKPLKSA